MNPTARNVLAVILGIVIGSAVNMGILGAGMAMVKPPEGVNPNDMESIKANIDKYELRHLAVPFLAHALGALVGAFAAAKIAASHHFPIALGVSAFFLVGGIYMAAILPAPLWYEALDLIVAYLPMGWLGHKLATPRNTPTA